MDKHQNPYLDSVMRARINQGCSQFLENQNFTWWLTANFNRQTTKDQGYNKLKEWHSRVDSKIYRRNYYKKKRDERTFFIAIPETGGYSGYLHYHILAKMPVWGEEKFELIAEPIWLELVESGSLDVQKINEAETDRKRVTAYGLKEIWRNSNFDDMILSDQFSTRH